MRTIKGIHWATGVILLLLGVLILVHLSATTLEYSRYNTGWNGTSAFFGMAEQRGAVELADAAELDGRSGALLLIAPEMDIGAEDAARYRAFAERGNTIVVAAGDAGANALLEAMGSTMRVDEGVLLSIDAEYATPASVRAFPAANDSLTANVSTLVLNTPRAITGGEAILATSVFAWVDRNGDQRVNRNESMQAYPVLCREPIGRGTLYVLGDTGIFLNGMLERPAEDNARMIENLLGRGTPVVIDQAHSPMGSAEGLTLMLNELRNATLMKILLVLCLFMPLFYAVGNYAIKRRKGGDDAHG